MAIVTATAGEDIFTGTGGANNTTTGNDTIVYTATNQVDNTLADPANGVEQSRDSIDGGAGFDTIQVGNGGAGISIDFGKASLVPPVAPPALFLNIEALAFTNTSGTSTAKFLAEQFGTGLITNSLQVTGTLGAAQSITIDFLNDGGVFDASLWTFLNWTVGQDTLTILGSAGADTITGSTVADTIDGNAGNDTINIANGSFVTGESLNGGADVDALVLTNATTVDFTVGTLAQIESLTGSSGDDAVTMSFGQWRTFASAIDLGAGLNTLNVVASTIGVGAGGGGGGGGAVPAAITNVTTGNLVGTSGDDAMTASGGQLDAIIVGAGTIDLGLGTDTLNLTSTSADLNALGLTDAGISGLEIISVAGAAAGATVTLSGQTEAFTLTGGAGSDTLTGGSGADVIGGAGGSDNLNGGLGADTLTGGGAADTMSGGAGNDTFNLASGDFASGEQINGDADQDAIVLTGAQTVDFSLGTIAAIETLTGSGGLDTVTMTATQWSAFQSIDLGAGNNVLNVIASGDIAAGPTPVLANITTGHLRGTGGNDSLTLSGAQLDAILIGAGTIDLGVGAADTINLTSTSAQLNALGASNAAIAGVEIVSAANAATAVTIALSGQTEAFTIAGGSGGDTLTGGTGADVVSGNAGGDTISGGAGADSLTGGSGSDTFGFAAGDSALIIGGNLTTGTLTGFDVVTDFAAGAAAGVSDRIAFAGASTVADTSATNGTNSVLQLHTGAVAASHRIVNGIVTFDDAETFAAAVPLQTTGDVAAAVQYLQANSFGGGASVAFTATLGGVAHTFVFIQGNAAGTNNQDVLVDLPNVTATSMIAAAGQLSIFVAPVAVGDALAAVEDTQVTYAATNLLANDISATSIASVTSGTGGTVVLNPDGSVTFTPNANFSGAATFTYVATDGTLNSDSGTVTVTVQAVNDTPTAVSDAAAAIESGSAAGADATGNVLTNDTDVDVGDTKTVTTTGQLIGAHGTLTLSADGSYVYQVNNADIAVDSLRRSTETLTDGFIYTMRDTVGATSSASLAITIHGANDAPVAADDAGTAVETGVAAGSNATGNVLTNDTDVDAGDTKTVTTTGSFAGAHGTLTLNADGSYSYAVSNADAAVNALRLASDTLTETFNYTMRDTAGVTASADLIITIQGANDAPVAVGDVGAATEAGLAGGSNATGNVLANDTEADAGDIKSVTTTGLFAGAHGSLTLNADGSFTYVVNNADASVNALRLASETLTDTFNYTMRDIAGTTSSASLLITISGANDGPVAVGDVGSAVKAGNLPGTDATGNVLVNDLDPDAGDTKTVTTAGVFGGLHGNLTLGSDGAYTYAIDPTDIAVAALHLPTDTLTETFNYTITDAAGAQSSADLVFTIHGANTTPSITAGGASAASPLTIAENETSVAVLTALDADVPGQTLTWSLAAPSAGNDNALFAVDAATGALSFLASPDFESVTHGPLYRIVVSVSDGIEAVSRDLFVRVTDVAPVLADIDDNVGRTLLGTSENDSISGLGGDDTLLGGGANDQLFGGLGSDLLDGQAGGDTMTGGDGSDTYVVSSIDDVTRETNASLALGGNDIVLSAVTETLSANIERLTLTGTLAVNGTGNNLSNVIIGNRAANVLNGGRGNDTLTGGLGADRFVFNSKLAAATNHDLIIGFKAVDDTIVLENTGAGLFNTLATGKLSAAAFAKGAGLTSGQDASDRIVYNTTTGDLYYDADGSGGHAAVRFATLVGHPALTGADFVVI